MQGIKVKLTLFNVLSKLLFAGLFLILMPFIVQRINLRETDNDLIRKREKVISMIQEVGIEPFIAADSADTFGSFNILKDEYISLEKADSAQSSNYFEDMPRLIDDELIEYRVLVSTFKADGRNYLLEVGKSLSSIGYMEANTRKVILLFMVFLLVITSVTDWQYTRLLLMPLDKITRKLSRISDPLRFDRTPVKTSTRDFNELDRSLRELMERIDLMFMKEKETTVNISHELLTPVSVMRSKLENLMLREGIDNETRDKIEESLKTLHRLQSLVNSLLMIARIESRQYLLDEDIRIREVLDEIISEISPIAEDSGVNIKNEGCDDYVFRNSNRPLVFSMLYNVINNSVKNTPSGGEVSVSGIDGIKFIITVTDNGKGLSEEQMKNIFSRFKMRTGESGNGTGIGLAIAKSIADLHNIEIQADSKPGKGTKISFIFPRNS